MLEVGINIDLRDVMKGLDTVSKRSRNLIPVFRSLKEPAKADQRTNFSRKQGPDGTWPALAASTLLKRLSAAKSSAKRRRRRPPRKASRRILGKLKTAWSFGVDRTHLRIYSKVPWSGVQQDGGPAGNDATIPQRTHIWFSNQFTKIAVERIRDYVWGRW